jgi:c-di-GMP phosphodiesterase
MFNVFIARQPIYNRALDVYGYELLARRSAAINQADVRDGDQATSEVILNAYTVIGLEKLVGTHRAFINLTRHFLLNHNDLPFSPKQVVLEILEDIPVDEHLIAAAKALDGRGYHLALDDLVLTPRHKPLLDHVRVVKLDVQTLDEAQLKDHVKTLQRYPLMILAEKIETEAQLTLCRELGIDLYQGFYFSRPQIFSGQTIHPAQRNLLRLIAKLQDPQSQFADIEQIIRQDVALSYKLLRYINSAFFALPRKISAIDQAVTYLGLQGVRSWGSLIALSEMHPKPEELMTLAITRAKMCEVLAGYLQYDKPQTYFTAGMFSALDAILQIPMSTILQDLPLDPMIANALLRGEGRHGEILCSTLNYESGLWDDARLPNLNDSMLVDAYLQSIDWAKAALQSLN